MLIQQRRFPLLPAGAGKWIATALAAAAVVTAPSARASFLPPEMMDTAAMGLAWFIIIFVPIGAIILFWLVHILPEKIAHKRHHPQRDAIQTLCLLSLVFGGLLWPIAWLWAYTRPIGYRMAYGTDKHEDYFREMGEKALAGELTEDEVAHVRAEIEAIESKGTLPLTLKLLRKEVQAKRAAAAQSGTGARSGDA